jgi:NADPH2:quinone reductase
MVAKVVAAAFGGPEVLTLIDGEAPPPPGPGQVLMEVRAAGTNPIDAKLIDGLWGRDPSWLPMSLGLEASGVVLAVGPGAEGGAGPIAVGDEVIAYPINGAYAAQVVVPASSVVPKGAVLSFEEASGLLLTGATAVHALSAVGVNKGETLLLHGASGGVGLMVVQLAVASGVRVIGTASEARHADLRRMGAEPVVYGPGLADRVRDLAPDGVDAAIDGVGTEEALNVSVELVADRQRIATVANARRGLELGIRALGAVPGADPGTQIRDEARFELVRLAEAGTVTVTVAAAYPLAQASEALAQLATGHTHGKIVLVP